MIRLASIEDAHLIHKIMLSTFEEYRNSEVPSGHLIKDESEQALLYYKDGIPVGTVRFRVDNNSLYFFRLSVCPEARRRGIAKKVMLKNKELPKYGVKYECLSHKILNYTNQLGMLFVMKR